MFKNILVPVDLADVAAAEPALARAVEMVSASGGKLRLIYVRSILPVTYMEFIPAEFRYRPAGRMRAQARRARGRGRPAAGAHLDRRPARLGLQRGARRRAEDRRRSHRRRLAPADHGELPPRLERLDHRAPRRELGAGRAGVDPTRRSKACRFRIRVRPPRRPPMSRQPSSPLPPPLPSPFS